MLVIWHLFALWGLMFINIWLLNSSVMPIMSPDVYDVLMRPSKQQMACVSPARACRNTSTCPHHPAFSIPWDKTTDFNKNYMVVSASE